MAQKTQMVTIPLEEYKELLLKDKPQGSNDSQLLEKILNCLEQDLEYCDEKYYSGYVGRKMRIKHADDVVKEVMKIIKYLDFDRYMSIWNKVMSAHRKEEEQKLKIQQMNEAKEIREQNKAQE